MSKFRSYVPEPTVNTFKPDMVYELQRASRNNQRIQERFQRLTSNLYLAIVDGDWDRADDLKTKLNAISEILTDV